jgi:hypothetical protein
MTAPIWPARLHHLRRDSADPALLARFYGDLLGDRVEPLSASEWLIAGRDRVLVVGKGDQGAVPYFSVAMRDAAHPVPTAATWSSAASPAKPRPRRYSSRGRSPSPIRTAGALFLAFLFLFPESKAKRSRACSISSAPARGWRR